MSGSLLSIVVFLVVGTLASAWLLGVRLRREQRRIGLRALSDMHWREFQRLVVMALQRDGCQRLPGSGAGEHEGVVALRRAEGDWLLSTRHGVGSVLGLTAVNEFASAMRLQGADGGWMATPGRVSPDVRSQARLHRIEVMDGADVWTAVAPVLEATQREEILGEARRRALRSLVWAWVFAAVAGVAALLLSSRTPVPPPSPGAATDITTDAAAAMQASARDTTAPHAIDAVPDDPVALAERRRRLASAIATLPWVDRALWSTQSTLVVHLSGPGDADKEALCALVEPYAELRASRLQLQPPRGSDRPVRFIQCRSF